MSEGKKSDKKDKRPAINAQVIIIVAIAAAIIVAIILSNQTYSDTKKRATDQFNQEQLALARSAATNIEYFIINLENDLLALSELPAVQTLEPGSQEELKAQYLSFPSETSLRLLGKKGALSFIYPNESWRTELIGHNYSGEAYFQRAMDTGDVVVSGLMVNEMGETRIRVVRPVYIEDENGYREFNGVIIASIDPQIVSETFIAPVVSGETGYAWLLNEEGIFLAHHEADFVGQDAFKVRVEKNPKLSYEAINEIQQRMMTGEEGLDRYVSGWHRERVERHEKNIAYTPVQVGDHIWSVAVCAPIEEVELIIAAAHPRELLVLVYIILLLIAGGTFVLISEHRKKSIQEQEVRKRTKELRESEEEYRALVESTEDSVYLLDRDCRYLYINEKHLSRLGLPADQVIGTTYGESHSPEETKELVEKVNQVFETGKSIRHEHRSRRDNKYSLRTLSPVKEPDGTITAVTVVSKDITALKQTEKELIETKDYLDNIINSSADTVTVMDMDGIVRDWNKGADGFMGYRADEVIGKQNSILFANPEDADRIQKLVRRDGEIKNYRTIALRQDGKPVHISMSAALLKDKDGVPIGSVRVSRDVTKVAEWEKQIEEERDNLNLILESMVDAVYIISKDYKIEFMNRVLIDKVGDQVGDICYKAFHDRVAPCPQCKTAEVMTGKTIRWEWYSRRMNKTYDLIETPLRNVDGMISKLTIIRDITKRKRMEQELDKSHKFIETVIENIPDTITLKDSEHRLVLVNQAFCDISGATKDEVIGKTVLREKDNEVFQTGKGLDLTERTYTDREGNRHYVSVKKAPLTDKSGKVSHVLTISRDITEHKREDEERERLLKEIETKNSELERFSYTVSHDLRSPLVTIQGFAHLMREDLEQGKTEDLASQLEYIETAAIKMDRLITDTLQLSRIGRVANPPVDVPFGALVQEAQEQTQEQIKSSGVEVNVADDFPTVHVDQMRIVEVLVNLITNSIKYMGEQRHPKIDIGHRVDGKETVFLVQDNGMGIDKSQHEMVFALFHKVDGSSNGTGAGLAIVKRIIEVHGGRIWIESEVGKGCTVCFTLAVHRKQT